MGTATICIEGYIKKGILIIASNNSKYSNVNIEKYTTYDVAYDVCTGKVVHNWDENNYFELDSENGNEESDLISNINNWLIVSSKCKDIIEKYTNENQM